MHRNRSIIGVLIYLTCLVVATVAHAQIHAVPKPPDQSFNDWFWHSMDWHSFGSAALAGLMGGAIRTIATLRSLQPTFRVFLETLGDALTALVSGFVVFLLLLFWQNFFGRSVDHNVTFVLAFVAGLVRGGVVTALDDFVKKALAICTDGAIAWLAGKAKTLANQQAAETQSPPVEEEK